MQDATVCYLTRMRAGRTEVCLVRKKRGHGAGNLVGYGGKIDSTDYHDLYGAIRETREESTVKLIWDRVILSAILTTFSEQEANRWRVSVFTCDSWEGEPTETEECGPPEWYPVDDLPFERMFRDARDWMKLLFSARYPLPIHVTVFQGTEPSDVFASFIGEALKETIPLGHRYF